MPRLYTSTRPTAYVCLLLVPPVGEPSGWAPATPPSIGRPTLPQPVTYRCTQLVHLRWSYRSSLHRQRPCRLWSLPTRQPVGAYLKRAVALPPSIGNAYAASGRILPAQPVGASFRRALATSHHISTPTPSPVLSSRHTQVVPLPVRALATPIYLGNSHTASGRLLPAHPVDASPRWAHYQTSLHRHPRAASAASYRRAQVVHLLGAPLSCFSTSAMLTPPPTVSYRRTP